MPIPDRRFMTLIPFGYWGEKSVGTVSLILEQGPDLHMNFMKVGLDLGAVPLQKGNGELSFGIGFWKPDPPVLSVGECDELPLYQTKEKIRAYLAHFPFPFGDPGVGGHEVRLFADAGHRSVYLFKEAFVIECGIRIVGFAEELMGQVGKNGSACLFPVHHIVLCLV